MRYSRASASANKMREAKGFLLPLCGLLLWAAPLAAKGRKPPDLLFHANPSVVTAGKTLVLSFDAPPRLEVPKVTDGVRTAYFFRVSTGTWRAFWGVGSQEPAGPKALRFEAFWGKKVLTSTATFSVQDGVFRISRVPLSKAQDDLFSSGQLAADNKALAKAYGRAPTPDRLWDGLFVWPSSGVISSPYGSRRIYGNRPPGSGHSGTDIAAPEGTPISAPAPGKVVINRWLESFGHTVLLDHGQGVMTYYLHMTEATAKEGAMLRTGDPVGLMGEEGIATGPHLHWSMVVAGERVDPLEWTERLFE